MGVTNKILNNRTEIAVKKDEKTLAAKKRGQVLYRARKMQDLTPCSESYFSNRLNPRFSIDTL